MKTFLTFKTRTIIIAAMLGAIYGFIAAIVVNGHSAGVCDVVIAVVGSAALCASAGSMFCRLYETLRMIRESNDPIGDSTLCSRGIRYHVELNDVELNDHCDKTRTHAV